MHKLAVLFTVFACIGALQAENLIAEWDFTKGSINSTNGKFQTKTRGYTKIAGDAKTGKFLAVGMTNQDKPEGLITQAIYPQLSPQTGFRLEAKVRLREQTSPKIMQMIWDNKYVYYTPQKSNPNFNRGMAFYLVRRKDNRFNLCISIGCGDKGSETTAGDAVALNEDQIYNLAVTYNGAGEFLFQIDGKSNGVRRGKIGAPIVPAYYKTAIGDRFGASFCRFDGDIFTVKLFALPLKK